MAKWLFKIQAVYYFITGLWPILHIQSFMAITGPKTDVWLVKMVGFLTISIGLSLFFYAKSKPYLLSISSLLAYIIIDIYYVAAGVILPIYVGDAFVEFVLLVLIGVSWKRKNI